MVNWRRNFYAILAAEVLAVIGFNTSFPIIPLYLRYLGVTDPVKLNLWNGACAAVVAVALSVFSPLWGALSDSVGKRTMLLRAMVGGAVTMGLMTIVNHPWQMLALRGLQGALSGTVGAATVLVANISPVEELGFTLGLLQTGVYVGASLGPAIGGVLSDFLGYRANFLITGVILLTSAGIAFKFVRPDKPLRAGIGPLWRRMVPDFSLVSSSPGLITLLLVSCAIQVANSTVNPIMPLYIHSISPDASRVGSMTGIVLGFGALSAAIAAASLGRVSGRFGYERTLAVCLSGAVLVMIPQAFVHSPWQLLALRVLGGAMMGASEPSVNAMVALRTEKSRQGGVFGLNSGLNNAGATVGPMIGALASAAFGYSAAFFAAAVVLVASAIAARSVRRIQVQQAGAATASDNRAK